ncbi:MAG TPA: response regulator [Verrucomicrobiae bacterium]|jgi:CheY-like chemotaxis protein
MSDTAKHNVLFLDDDPDFLLSIQDLYATMSGRSWNILTAITPDRALEILDTERIDLVVVDVNMPIIDGIQFLGILQRRHPKLKRAVLTALATPEKRAASLANGADLFMEKALTPEGYKSIFVMLGELLQWVPKEGFEGVLRKVGLQDVIQMECLARNSSVLEIYNEHVLGQIYIEEGQIVHAVGGDLVGERALQKLLSLPGGSFELAQFQPPEYKSLSGSWEMLLMNAAQACDENAALLQQESKANAAVARPTIQLEETLVCNINGDTLFNAVLHDAPARVSWLQSMDQKVSMLGQLLPLGNFDRLESQLVEGRAISLSRGGKLIFVRVSTPLGNK